MTPKEKSPPPPLAKPLQPRAAANDNDPLVVTLTVSQLRALMREAVAESTRANDPAVLLDKPGLARVLDCSSAHIDVLRKRGLPTVPVGQAVRFDREAVLAWLKGGANHNERETP